MKKYIKKTWRLQTKITILVMGVVFISISIIMFFIIPWTSKNVQNKVEVNVMNVARLTAKSANIKEDLSKNDPDKEIQSYVNVLLSSVENIEFIVVADMDGIRYAHPNPERVGERFVGGDFDRVVNNGETYISQAQGTLGKSLRAFTPIYDPDNQKQIGFVSVGTLYKDIEKAKIEAIRFIVLLTLIGLVVGTIGAFLLAKNIKNSLMGLEPSQITKLYNENIAMMDAIHEGILAVDQDGRVTIINDSAMNMLKIEEKNKNNIKGKNVKSVFPTSKLPRVLESGIAEYDKELITNGTIVVANRVPIISKGKIIGAIATFRDKTELTMLAEELTGVKLIIEALRANSHEFANKLHVILGLIKIGEIEEAKNYIINVADTQQQILSMIIKRIKDPTIAGLILGKFSRAKELGISIKIDKRTKLECKHKHINSNVLVTIIGNLIANALESVSKSDKEEKSINVRIEESESKIIIEVEDFGVGIKKENIKKIFERGFTDKSESRGIGLALVKENVQSLNGEIKVISKINKGTTFTIILPKGGTK